MGNPLLQCLVDRSPAHAPGGDYLQAAIFVQLKVDQAGDGGPVVNLVFDELIVVLKGFDLVILQGDIAVFSEPGSGWAHDCRDAGGRATQGAVAEGTSCWLLKICFVHGCVLFCFFPGQLLYLQYPIRHRGIDLQAENPTLVEKP